MLTRSVMSDAMRMRRLRGELVWAMAARHHSLKGMLYFSAGCEAEQVEDERRTRLESRHRSAAGRRLTLFHLGQERFGIRERFGFSFLLGRAIGFDHPRTWIGVINRGVEDGAQPIGDDGDGPSRQLCFAFRVLFGLGHGEMFLGFLDGCSHEVAPLGPTSIVVLHMLVAEQIFQDKPGVT